MTLGSGKLGTAQRAIIAGLRQIPAGTRGKSRLARLLLPRLAALGEIVVTLPAGERLSMPSAREPIAFHCLIDGVYEPELIKLMLRFLPAGATFLDVGANVGVFSVLGSRMVGPSGRVIAVEASPRINPFLARNIAQNDCGNVEQIAQAVADRGPGLISFWPAPSDKFGMGSLAPQFSAEAVTIEADTIDHMLAARCIGHVDLMKIDVEGFEAAAFRGAQLLLTRQPRPVVVFEFVDWAETRAGAEAGDAQRLLLAYGYTLHSIGADGCLEELESPQTRAAGNLVAVPSERAAQIQ